MNRETSLVSTFFYAGAKIVCSWRQAIPTVLFVNVLHLMEGVYILHELLLLIRNSHVEGSVTRFPSLADAMFIVRIIFDRPVNIVLLVAVVALECAFVGFDAAIDDSVVKTTSLSISLSELCVAAWFVLIAVILGLLGIYDPSFPKLRKSTLIWWIKYMLAFASTFLSIVGVSLIYKVPGPGLRICEYAAFSWFLAYLAFTFQNGGVPRWLNGR